MCLHPSFGDRLSIIWEPSMCVRVTVALVGTSASLPCCGELARPLDGLKCVMRSAQCCPCFPCLLFPDKYLTQKHHMGFSQQPDAVTLWAASLPSSLRQCIKCGDMETGDKCYVPCPARPRPPCHQKLSFVTCSCSVEQEPSVTCLFLEQQSSIKQEFYRLLQAL